MSTMIRGEFQDDCYTCPVAHAVWKELVLSPVSTAWCVYSLVEESDPIALQEPGYRVFLSQDPAA